MSTDLLAMLAAFIPRDRAAHLFAGTALADRGVALIADISGFTPLTEGLAQALSAARGAEELTRALNSVFTPLIAAAHSYGGSVVKFGGDALIIWFPHARRASRALVLRRALAAGHAMQAAIARYGRVITDAGTYTLTMKIGMAYGPVLRMYLGNVLYGYEDVIGGETLDRMAEAEHHAAAGEVLLDPSGLPELAELAPMLERRAGVVLVGPPYRQPARAPIGLPRFAAPEDAAIVLRAYVPPEVYTALREGRAQPAELKPVVSMFVQFQGIRYEDGPAAEGQLRAYFDAAQRIAAAYGGRVNRLITGDKGSVLHLIFGAPKAIEDLELRAARCALELRALPAQLPFIAAQRIGMATGRAFAGPVGSPERNDYTVMGDAINLSARLMQQAAADQIVLGPTLAARLAGRMALTALGSAQLKGKAAPIALFTLERELIGRLRGAQVLGRDAELALLRAQLAELAAGRGGIVLLSGELGMGKTHLLNTLRHETTLRWVAATATDYGGHAGAALIGAAMRDLLDLAPGADYPALERALGLVLGEREGAASAPYLARLLGIALDERRARELDALGGESLRWRLNQLLGALVRATIARTPLVIALDDIQWADPTSLDLLGSVLALFAGNEGAPAKVLGAAHPPPAQTAPIPLLLILAARPDVRGRAEVLLERLAAGGAVQMRLGPLETDAAQAIIDYYAAQIGAAAREQVLVRGAGNPLFLVELARAAATSGPDAALPETIEGVLQAQIDRLPGPLRETLQLAAVLGSQGEPQLLAALSNSDVNTIAARIAALGEAGFLLPDEFGYRFRHGLIRESAYSAMLYARRRVHHRAAAIAIERLFPTQIAERSAVIGLHYERAGAWLAAARYHGQAADAARLLDAAEEAEAGYRHVLTLLDRAEDTHEQRGRTLLKLAQVQMNSGDYTAAQELYDQAFALLETTPIDRPHMIATEQTFRLGVYQHGPSTLDPGLCDASGDNEIIKDIFEGLVELDADLNIVPAAARRWHILDEGRRYRFELRPNLAWSDSTTLTAEDFIVAWRRNLDPHTDAPMAHLLYAIVGARAYHQGESDDPNGLGFRAIDDLTIEINLISPVAHFPFLLANPILYPQPRRQIAAYGKAWSDPARLVCNGAFRIARVDGQRPVELEPNPFARQAGRHLPGRIELRYVTPDSGQYQANNIDWVRIEDDHDDQMIRNSSIEILGLTTYLLLFSCAHPPFDRAEMRLSFAHSIDKVALVQQAWGGVQRAATGGLIPPGVSGYAPDISPAHDPQQARDLLRRAGLITHAPLVLAGRSGFGLVPNLLQKTWHTELGISVEIRNDLPLSTIFDGMQNGTIAMTLIGWDFEYPDPENILQGIFHSASPMNIFGWHSQVFDQLIDQAMVEAGRQRRLALYHRAEQLLVAEEAAVIPLYYHHTYGLLNPNFALSSESRVWRGDRFRLKYLMVK